MSESKVISNKGRSISILMLGDISAWYGANSKILYDTLRNKELEDIQLYISSDGGNLTEALVMYDMLRGHPAKVTAHLTGMVASAATIVACACDEVQISKQAVYMVHRASTISMGNANDLKKTASVLEIFDNKIVEIYSSFIDTRKKGVRKKILWELIDAESFTDHAGALELGLVDSIVDHVAFDFDTAEMDWRYYCSDVEDRLMADPKNLQEYGRYWNKLLGVKGYQYLSSKYIKSKITMKSINALFASIVAFLGGRGYLKEDMIEAAHAAADQFEPTADSGIEAVLHEANVQYLGAAKLENDQLRSELDVRMLEIEQQTQAVLLENKGQKELIQVMQSENQELKNLCELLRDAVETEKNAVKDLEQRMSGEIALIKGMKWVSAGNGAAVADPAVPYGEDMSEDELLFYRSAVARGQISVDQYKEITGTDFKT